MSNQLKRNSREKLKKKKNNIHRSLQKSDLHSHNTIIPDHRAISLFLKIPTHVTEITEICSFFGSNLQQTTQTNERDLTMQALTLTALYMLTKESDFKSEIMESDLRTVLKIISRTQNLVLAATEGVANPAAK